MRSRHAWIKQKIRVSKCSDRPNFVSKPRFENGGRHAHFKPLVSERVAAMPQRQQPWRMDTVILIIGAGNRLKVWYIRAVTDITEALKVDRVKTWYV